MQLKDHTYPQETLQEQLLLISIPKRAKIIGLEVEGLIGL